MSGIAAELYLVHCLWQIALCSQVFILIPLIFKFVVSVVEKNLPSFFIEWCCLFFFFISAGSVADFKTCLEHSELMTFIAERCTKRRLTLMADPGKGVQAWHS